MHQHEKLNYVEFGSTNINATKQFFERTFDWTFIDYGPEYSAFSGQGLDGGFFKSEFVNQTANGSALLVFYSSDIQATQIKVEQHGGKIIRPIFEFPGGCRFHFTEPSGNEFAVWSESN
ncbi:TPA: VOC family protein [Vibrio diabolicus]|uniref:VOC family protein n=1 Tax=Vibrio antiquarius (strain Ex25) TaxID=150340 RepID=UPI0026586AE5|nr:VOC family protein [Vibrio antiquarius]MCR9475576.1 VOC family protein [Vibrio antiquarius]